MAVVEETRATPPAAMPVADPAPLGLAAFALTTFMLSGHNANFIPDLMSVGLAVFLTLEITEILLAVGFWTAAHRGVAPTGAEVGWIRAGGWAGIVTAGVAWYASAALVLSAMNQGRAILPLGRALWTGDRLSFGRRQRLGRAHPA